MPAIGPTTYVAVSRASISAKIPTRISAFIPMTREAIRQRLEREADLQRAMSLQVDSSCFIPFCSLPGGARLASITVLPASGPRPVCSDCPGPRSPARPRWPCSDPHGTFHRVGDSLSKTQCTPFLDGQRFKSATHRIIASLLGSLYAAVRLGQDRPAKRVPSAC